MGQYLMTCPECGRPRDFMGDLPSGSCLYCGHDYTTEQESKMTIEQQASHRLNEYASRKLGESPT